MARRTLLLITPVLILFFGSLAGCSCGGAASAYRAEAAKHQCFAGRLAGFSADDLARGEKGLARLASIPVTVEAASFAADVGRDLFEKHRTPIASLLEEFEPLMASPLPTYQAPIVAAAQFGRPSIDLTYSRKLAESLMTIAWHLVRSGRHADALRLSSLVQRFGRIVCLGDANLPELIHHVVGRRIQISVCAAPLWQAILNGRNDPAVLALASRLVTERASAERGVSADLEQLLTIIRNSVRNVLSDPDDAGAYRKMADLIIKEVGSGQRDTLTARADALLKTISAEIIAAAEPWPVRPASFEQRLASIALRLETQARAPTGIGAVDRGAAGIACIMLTMEKSMLARALECRLIADLKLQGVGALTQVAGKLPSGQPWPIESATVESFLAGAIPADPFAEASASCRLKVASSVVVLYSVGPNHVDDGGDPAKDLILFAFQGD